MKEETTKNNLFIQVDKNAFIDDEKGKITFKNGLVITDDSEQRNGTRYDIKSLDISEFSGKLTANHEDKIQSVIGRVNRVKKIANKRVVIDAIQFAIEENALARFAYNMLRGGYLTDFSTETFGPWPDEDGVYKDAKLIGLSAVVIGNNRSSAINQIVKNSIEESKELGIDTSIVENNYIWYVDDEGKPSNNNINEDNEIMKFITIKNKFGFPVRVKFKNASGEDVEKTLEVGDSVDVSEDQKEAVEKQMSEAEAPKEEKKENTDNAFADALSKINSKLEALEKNAFDKNAKEPEFRKETKVTKNNFDRLNWRERHGEQIKNAWEYLKGGSQEAGQKLRDLNQFHLEQLQEKEIVSNSLTLADFGNFVISPELITEIQGYRSDYTPLINAVEFRETNSLQMAYLKRNGDIDMQPVEMCDDGADGNLKPISEYTADITTKDMEELAAVTPVCNSVTRFLASDLLEDVARGYRTDYDRKRAQLVIARLQQAVNTNGNSASFATTSDTNSVKAIIDALSPIAESSMNGTFIMNNSSYWRLVSALVGAGISGPLAGVFTTGDQPQLLGRPYIVVPNDLMPTLDTGNTNKTFTVDGVSVTINLGLIYADLSQFVGRTSGGLQYDLSTEAAYEVDGTVKSAYQRNELVLRGSFFRNGAIRDEDRVAGLAAPGVS